MLSDEHYAAGGRTNPLVYILLLNYGSPQDCAACIAAIRKVDYKEKRLLLIDNASPDNSVELLRPLLGPDELVELDSNTGYAGGNNTGISKALAKGADYVFIINPDVRISPGSLGAFVNLMESDASISALNPVQLKADGRTIDDFFGREMFEAYGYELPAFPIHKGRIWDVRTLFGAALFLPRSTIERVGAFDPLYFAYWEEIDFCRRIRYHGGRLCVTSAEPVVHLRNYSSSLDSLRRFLRLKGMHLFHLKNLGRSYPRLFMEKMAELAVRVVRPDPGEFGWSRRDYLRVFFWCLRNANTIRLHRRAERKGRAHV